MKPYPKAFKNIAAQWFHAAEATGDFLGIRYGRKSASSEKVEWLFISHYDCDGSEGFARLLRKSGARLSILPETNHPNCEIVGPLWDRLRKSQHLGDCKRSCGVRAPHQNI